jgi:hypothetical protein
VNDGAEMEPPALAENVAGAADAPRRGNADAFPREAPATQSVSQSGTLNRALPYFTLFLWLILFHLSLH